MHPTLSIIVVVYDMPTQAMNTLHSLAPTYQRGSDSGDYEIVVVENASDNVLEAAQVESLGPQYRYFLRDEPGVSPAPALNFGFDECRGAMIGLIVDGARMLTPGVLALVFDALRLYARPLVAVPGYHLGDEVQHAQDEALLRREQQFLAAVGWPADGYRLFENACFSEGNIRGYLQPMMECSALFCTRQSFASIGGAEEGFDQPGGGSLNLHTYRQLGMLRQNRLVVLPGEGSFHQYHGGVTTSAVEGREERLAQFNDRLNSYWGGQFRALSREPVLLGAVPEPAHDFFLRSLELGQKRINRLLRGGEHPWPDDEALARKT